MSAFPRPVHAPKPATPIEAAASECLLIPLLQLTLLELRRLHQERTTTGVTGMLIEQSAVAHQVLSGSGYGPVAAKHAREVAQRAARIMQGYEGAAKDKAFQVVLAEIERHFGDQGEEFNMRLCNAMVMGFAAYHSWLLHCAGQLTPLREGPAK